jgi:hypothetical protein
MGVLAHCCQWAGVSYRCNVGLEFQKVQFWPEDALK